MNQQDDTQSAASEQKPGEQHDPHEEGDEARRHIEEVPEPGTDPLHEGP